MYPTPKRADTIPVFTGRLGSWQLAVRRRAHSKTELVRLYDKAAHGWSQMLSRLGLPRAYGKLLSKVFHGDTLRTLGAPPRVLECGVGTGALAGALVDTLPMACAIDAIDISPRMLEQAKRRLRADNIDVTLRQADVRKLPYSSGAFDVVMSAHVLEHLAEPSDALREMARVLKPGGLLIVCITRRSALGMLMHLKWRTHQVTSAQAQEWLLESGFGDIRCVSPEDHALFRQLSVAYVGRKAD